MKIYSAIRLIRPEQWVKNCFVFLPMFFGGKIFDGACWGSSVISFIAFSLMASAVYCINDISDVEADRIHPEKRHRPIASNEISIGRGVVLAVLLVACSLGICLISPHRIEISAIILTYLVLNIAYTFKLKQFSIVDVFIISIGFVLRVICGGVASDIPLSPWIVLMTFLIALFMAFAKRRDDVVILENAGQKARRNIGEYNLTYLNITLGLLAGVTIVCYILYTLDPEVQTRLGSRYVYSTSIFVLAGILRYLQITIVNSRSGSPVKIVLHDRFIGVCIVLWIALFVVLIYPESIRL